MSQARDDTRVDQADPGAWRGLPAGGPGARICGIALLAKAELADLFDQLAPERRRGRDLAIGGGLWNVVGRAERQRLEAHFRVPARQRRRHDDDEIALLFEQQGQRLEPVEIGHVDIEQHDIGIVPRELIHGFAAVAQRGDGLQARLFVDPARDKSAHHDRVIDNHNAKRIRRGGRRGRRKGSGSTHSHTRIRGTQQNRIGRSARQISPTSWNLASTISLSKGFMMYSLAPALSARAICATSFSVVQNTTFGVSPPGMRRSALRKS